MIGYRSSLLTGYGTRTTEQVSVWTDGRDPEGAIPLILCHGLLGTASQWYDIPSQNFRIQREWASRGGLAAGGDLAGLSTWGNDDFIDSIDDLIAHLADTYGTREDRIGVYGTSMGGCCLNWVWRNYERVAACALTIPVVDLEGIHDRNPVGIGSLIELAYGGSAGYLAALPTHDPSHPDNVEIVAGISDRVRIWYSDDDNIIDSAEVLAYAEATGVVASSVGSVGHAVIGDQQEVIDWMIPLLQWG